MRPPQPSRNETHYLVSLEDGDTPQSTAGWAGRRRREIAAFHGYHGHSPPGETRYSGTALTHSGTALTHQSTAARRRSQRWSHVGQQSFVMLWAALTAGMWSVAISFSSPVLVLWTFHTPFCRMSGISPWFWNNLVAGWYVYSVVRGPGITTNVPAGGEISSENMHVSAGAKFIPLRIDATN